MAVFHVAFDETTLSAHRFLQGGFIAPVNDWEDSFSPAWEERVLKGLPHFHMVEMRSPQWQHEHGITRIEADRRVESAVDVVCSSGFLTPVTCHLSATLLVRLFGDVAVLKPDHEQIGEFRFDPDYLAFLGMCLNACVYGEANGAEKIDFYIEKKPPVTHRMRYFFDDLPDAFRQIGRGHLANLVGEFFPVPKDRIPVQSADLFCWHLQRMRSDDADRQDRQRFHRMTTFL